MANKPKDQKKTDPEMEALKGAYADGERAKQAEVDVLKAKLEVAPWLYEMSGKIKTLSFNEAQSRFFRLVMLKQVKDSKEYRERFGMTWEQFCESMGFNRRTLDEQLLDLKPFRAEFLANFASFSGFDFSKIKYLGNSSSEKVAELCQFSDNSIIYEGETIPVTAERADDIKAILERIEEALAKEREERAAEKKTHERRMADEKKHIQKLEKEINKYERHAHDKGLTAEEDAFLQRIDNLRTGFIGYMLQVEPTRMEALSADTDPSVRMRAEYIALLHAMRSQLNAAYDTAVEMFGDPAMLPEEGWHPGMKA